MTPRICIVGSSHVAAVRAASVRHPLRYPARLHFAALPGRSFRTIRADDKGLSTDARARWRPPRAEAVWWPQSGRIDYADFDAFVVYGTLRMEALLAMVTARASGRYSNGYVDAAEAAVLERDASFRLAAAIRRASGAPTFVLCMPMPARPPRTAAGRPLTQDDWDAATRRLERACAAAGLHHRPQPAPTLNRRFATRHRFARGTTRLTGKHHRAEDRQHMNADFGRRVLDDLIPAVTAALDPGRQEDPAPAAGSAGAAARQWLVRLTRSA